MPEPIVQSELAKRLEELAKATGRTPNDLVRDVVRGFLNLDDTPGRMGVQPTPTPDSKNSR